MATADEDGWLSDEIEPTRVRPGALTFLALVLVLLIGFVVVREVYLPPANCCYRVAVEDGVVAETDSGRAAALARHYLDEQTPELAAPELHRDPIVRSVTAVHAIDALPLEPRIPRSAVVDDPSRLVWVADVSGDFLNLSDLAWSRHGAAWSSGTIVIDDATSTTLGVYPREPLPSP